MTGRRTALLGLVLSAASLGVASAPARTGAGLASAPVTPVYTPWRATQPLARGIGAWANGRRPEALKWFRLAVGVAPRDPIAWHNLGVALYCASRYDEALDAFLKERFLAPTAASASFGVGVCELAKGLTVEAERDLIVAISLAPREWQYWHALADVFLAQHREADAAAAADRATSLRPRHSRARWTPLSVERSIMTLRFPSGATFR